jgi:hypothetical protein
MRLAIVVPCDNFHELRLELENLIPAIEPKEITWEHPVLAVGDFRPVIWTADEARTRGIISEILTSREPRGDRSKVRLPTECAIVARVASLDRDVAVTVRSLVEAIVRPCHPVQSAVDEGEVALARVEVGHEENGPTGSWPQGRDVEAISGKRGGKHLTVDEELRRLRSILSNLLANLVSLTSVPPVKIERDEDLIAAY